MLNARGHDRIRGEEHQEAVRDDTCTVGDCSPKVVFITSRSDKQPGKSESGMRARGRRSSGMTRAQLATVALRLFLNL